MENALFWVSAVMAVGVLGLTWLSRVLHIRARDHDAPVSSLPDDR